MGVQLDSNKNSKLAGIVKAQYAKRIDESLTTKEHEKEVVAHGEGSEASDILKVKVHKARNLENLDDFGKSDPFVIIQFGLEEAKSETISNSLNPEWEFCTQYNVDNTSPELIYIRVLDDDYGKSELIGELTLDVSTIKKKGKMLNHWLPLDKSKNGEVLMSVEYNFMRNPDYYVATTT